MARIIKDEGEACRILHELMNTPNIYSIHFEFDISADSVPMVDYRVKQFAYTVEEEDGKADS